MNKKIKYGDVDAAKDFESGNGKTRITSWIDHDIKVELKRRAGGSGYQTIMNEILRKALFNEEASGIDNRLSHLEKEFAKLKKTKRA